MAHLLKINQYQNQNKLYLECIRDILYETQYYTMCASRSLWGYSANGDFSSPLTKAEMRFAGVVWAIYLNWLACVRSLSRRRETNMFIIEFMCG